MSLRWIDRVVHSGILALVFGSPWIVCMCHAKAETDAEKDAETIARDRDSSAEPGATAWRKSLQELTEVMIEMASEDGGQHLVADLEEFLDRGANITEDECRGLLHYAAKVANKYRNQCHWEEAAKLSELTIDVLVSLGEEQGKSMGVMLTLRGAIAADCKDFSAARKLFREAIGCYLESEPEELENQAVLWLYMAIVEKELGQLDQAEEILLELLARTELEKSYHHAVALACLGDLHSIRGEHAVAFLYSKKSVKLLMASKSNKMPAASLVISRFAIANAMVERFEAANKAMDLALQIAIQQKGFLNGEVANRHEDYANILLMQDSVEEAREHLQEAIETREALHGEDHHTVRALQSKLYGLQADKKGDVLSTSNNVLLSEESNEESLTR